MPHGEGGSDLAVPSEQKTVLTTISRINSSVELRVSRAFLQKVLPGDSRAQNSPGVMT